MTIAGLFVRCVGIPIFLTISIWNLHRFMATSDFSDIIRGVGWLGAFVALSIESYLAWKKS